MSGDKFSRIDGDLSRSSQLPSDLQSSRNLFDTSADIIAQTRPAIYRNRYPGEYRYLTTHTDNKHVGDWVHEQNQMLDQWTNEHENYKRDLYLRRNHIQLRSSGLSKHSHPRLDKSSSSSKTVVAQNSPFPLLKERKPLKPIQNSFTKRVAAAAPTTDEVKAPQPAPAATARSAPAPSAAASTPARAAAFATPSAPAPGPTAAAGEPSAKKRVTFNPRLEEPLGPQANGKKPNLVFGNDFRTPEKLQTRMNVPMPNGFGAARQT
jgi:hypothetical protein